MQIKSLSCPYYFLHCLISTHCIDYHRVSFVDESDLILYIITVPFNVPLPGFYSPGAALSYYP
jgi:hypothetical protein